MDNFIKKILKNVADDDIQKLQSLNDQILNIKD